MNYPTEKLGNHIQVLSGFAFKSKDFSDTGIPVIKIKNITPPSVSLIDLSYVPEEIADQNRKFILSYDDVLIALTGSHINQMASVVGRVAKVKYSEKTVLNQRVGKITVNDSDDCDLDFVYYYLSQDKVKIELASKAGGAANQANISPTDIKNLMFPFPNIDVQRKIASVLRTYDDLIENNQKQIKLLEEAAQRLYKEWFIDLRFPGHETTPIVDGVPEGWKQLALEQITPILTGKKDANFSTEDGRYPFFTCAQTPLRAPSYSFDCSAVILAGNGDFNVKLYRGKFEAYQRTYVLSPECTEYLYLLYHAVNNSMVKLSQAASGSTIKFLTKGMIASIPVYTPEVKNLEKFNTLSEAIQKQIEVLKKSIANATEARNRLLPKLMSGEIEV